jgi:phosphoribosylaminoimidazole-succinocarboxamide synthase
MIDQVLFDIELKNLELFSRGKVRDIFKAGNDLLMVATDRISAYDSVLPTAIPGKGRVLTQLSLFWFRLLEDIVPNHLLTDDMSAVSGLLSSEAERLQGRAMLVKKAAPLAAEFIVRGYLAGSGWAEYQRKGTVCGIPLPAGLLESSRLERPLLTPSTKAEQGEHDENISVERLAEIIGADVAAEVEPLAVEIFSRAGAHAESKGFVLCDTKFEFGIHDGRVTLIDEVLTPDSSRFWSKEGYVAGSHQESFDKQYVRDYLVREGWDKKPPAPALPDDVVSGTARKYNEALERLTG